MHTRPAFRGLAAVGQGRWRESIKRADLTYLFRSSSVVRPSSTWGKLGKTRASSSVLRELQGDTSCLRLQELRLGRFGCRIFCNIDGRRLAESEALRSFWAFAVVERLIVERLFSHVRGWLPSFKLARCCDQREAILEWELPVVDQVPFPPLVSRPEP